MRVLVTGDRNWTDRQTIRHALADLPAWAWQKTGNDAEEITIIHGAARGADTIAGQEAKYLGFKVIPCPADWRRYGRAAGPIRNQYMLQAFLPSLVLAFHHNLAESRGTKDMVERARKWGITVQIIDRVM